MRRVSIDVLGVRDPVVFLYDSGQTDLGLKGEKNHGQKSRTKGRHTARGKGQREGGIACWGWGVRIAPRA